MANGLLSPEASKEHRRLGVQRTAREKGPLRKLTSPWRADYTTKSLGEHIQRSGDRER